MANATEEIQSLSISTDFFASAGWCPYETAEIVCTVIVTGALSLVTIIGNILVIISIKINRHLQTTNNYFIFSLACADLIIGAFSMNLYTVYTVNGYWPLGPVICDLWLTVDYVVSNASVMNLLIISFDRYFCVKKPLIYPVKRTTKMVGMMVAAAWVLSFFLWAPAILFWQFIVGERIVQEGECYVQFFSNPPVTFGTAIVSFYIPVTIMTILYVHISRASKTRMKDDRIQPELCMATVTPTVVNGKLMKSNRTKTANTLDELLEVNIRNRNDRENRTTNNIINVTRTHFKRANGAVLREKKVTRTILAILLVFIITFTPYHVMVLLDTFCLICVPSILWNIGYWLCYINSTLNPACYALCNMTFKKTFKHLLLCQYKNISATK
ncbi:muscarinic acetylcholine receptor M2-like [Hemiscyllium ocellatum]|uniref:muscarinic acetylcholine receptor M2-like n=1 Tax=Hemiscyllium ocellatum TaxID=170820 RepID=UPI00296715AF|nr:muscarinic acetylcholine receptor M2-like [Hemiscyllium ocellatum]